MKGLQEVWEATILFLFLHLRFALSVGCARPCASGHTCVSCECEHTIAVR